MLRLIALIALVSQCLICVEGACKTATDASYCTQYQCCNSLGNCATSSSQCYIYANTGRCGYLNCDFCCINNKCGTYEECETWIIAMICIWVAITAIVIGLVCFKRNKTIQRINMIYNRAQKAEQEAMSENIKREKERTHSQNQYSAFETQGPQL